MDHEDFRFGHGRSDGAHALLDVFLFVKARDDYGDARVGFHAENLEMSLLLASSAVLSKFQVVQISYQRKIINLSHG
jgi:hypothetical protein